MRHGSADRRTRILKSLAPDRQELVLSLKQRIVKGQYDDIDQKLELVFDDLLEEAVRQRN